MRLLLPRACLYSLVYTSASRLRGYVISQTTTHVVLSEGAIITVLQLRLYTSGCVEHYFRFLGFDQSMCKTPVKHKHSDSVVILSGRRRLDRGWTVAGQRKRNFPESSRWPFHIFINLRAKYTISSTCAWHLNAIIDVVFNIRFWSGKSDRVDRFSMLFHVKLFAFANWVVATRIVEL